MNDVSGSGQLLFFIPFFILMVVMLVGMWKIYQKAGYQGWECIIPIYSTIILLRIVGKPWWWFLLMMIPLVNIIVAVWMTNMLSKSFGKSEGFTVGLLLLPFIFYPILGFGSAKYLGPFGDPAAFAAYGDKGKFDFEEQSRIDR